MTFDLEEFQQSKFKVSVPLAAGAFLVIFGYIMLGTWSLINIYDKARPFLAAFLPPVISWISDNAFWIVALPLVSIAIATALLYITLKLFRRNGLYFIYAAIGLNIVLGVMVAILSLLTGLPLILLVFELLVFLVVPILFLLLFRGLVVRAAGFMEMSAEIFFEEREVLLPTIMLQLLISYLGISSAGIHIALATMPTIFGTWIPTQEINAVVITLLLTPFYYFIYTFFYFFLMSMNVGIAYIWYRGRDPNLRDGVRVALSRLYPIIVFSFYTAVVHLVRMVIKSLGGKYRWLADVAEAASGFLADVWRGINYFTLQTLVIERVSAFDAIKRSLHTLIKYIPDVITKEVFMPVVMRGIIFLLVLATVAAGLVANLVLQPPWWLALIGVLLAIFGITLPYLIFLKTFQVSYNTFLYSWAIDQEYAVSGPYRLPPFVEDVINRIKGTPVGVAVEKLKPGEKPTPKTCIVCNKTIEREAYRCQTCGELACEDHSKMYFGKRYCSNCLEKKMGTQKS